MLVFPALSGVVSFTGQVLANVEVVRTFENRRTYQQVVRTDSQGQFSFDSLAPTEMTHTRWACWNRLNRRVRRQWFSSITISSESITIQYQGKIYVLWQRDYIFYAGESQPNRPIRAELSEQPPYFQYLDWDNVISSCCDLQLEGQKPYYQVSQHYQDHIDEISVDLRQQLLTAEARYNATQSFAQLLESIARATEQGQPYPPNYDSRLLAYSKLDGVHIEVVDLELRLQKTRFCHNDNYLFWCSSFEEQDSISSSVFGYILYRLRINGHEEQFLARTDKHKAHFDCETLSYLGTKAESPLFIISETALLDQYPSESQPFAEPPTEMGW